MTTARAGKAACSANARITLQLAIEKAQPSDYPVDFPPGTITEAVLLNRYDRSSPMNGEAEVKYLDGDFRVVRPGAFVRCAVAGVPIPLEELKYWSVDLQEAYASPEAVLKRLRQAP